jgi:haloalkane dehalogenase
MRIEFTPDPKLYPFKSHWFESSHGRVHYVDEGSGPVIVLYHGNPTWSFLYRDVIRGLRDHFRCIAPDYLGFGLSDRPPRFGYRIEEHATVMGELVDHLSLDGFVSMGQDWGGPISMAVGTARADRVRGVALGNTWFWPADRRAALFSRVMSSRPLQRAILRRNLFVERVLPAGIARDLTEGEMEHYRAVQPTPAARTGVAELPRQIVAAEPFLAELAEVVPRELGDKRVLITFAMRDFGLPAKSVLPRLRAAFRDVEVVELPEAKHFFAEDAPEEVALAVSRRFR